MIYLGDYQDGYTGYGRHRYAELISCFEAEFKPMSNGVLSLLLPRLLVFFYTDLWQPAVQATRLFILPVQDRLLLSTE